MTTVHTDPGPGGIGFPVEIAEYTVALEFCR
jgi:hypothetical protein